MEAPICPLCESRPLERQGGWGSKKYIKFRRSCQSCRLYPYRQFKKKSCEFCGFVAVNSCQLDVDHIDGNHSNNDESNLQTLCANCHRLKTHMSKDIIHARGQL